MTVVKPIKLACVYRFVATAIATAMKRTTPARKTAVKPLPKVTAFLSAAMKCAKLAKPKKIAHQTIAAIKVPTARVCQFVAI